jgi:hypothetical protein
MATNGDRSRIEWLEKEGVLNPATLTDAEKKKIEKLTDPEVQHLVSSRKKVGDMASRSGGSPWIL